jgi:hypothetical protein
LSAPAVYRINDLFIFIHQKDDAETATPSGVLISWRSRNQARAKPSFPAPSTPSWSDSLIGFLFNQRRKLSFS